MTHHMRLKVYYMNPIPCALEVLLIGWCNFASPGVPPGRLDFFEIFSGASATTQVWSIAQSSGWPKLNGKKRLEHVSVLSKTDLVI